jgi:hypothetical protein
MLGKVRDLVVGSGGTLEQTWQTAGTYDFVPVAAFPDLEAKFRARNAVTKLGVVRVDQLLAMPIGEALGLIGGRGHDERPGRRHSHLRGRSRALSRLCRGPARRLTTPRVLTETP